jgi:hypothetical protein
MAGRLRPTHDQKELEIGERTLSLIFLYAYSLVG